MHGWWLWPSLPLFCHDDDDATKVRDTQRSNSKNSCRTSRIALSARLAGLCIYKFFDLLQDIGSWGFDVRDRGSIQRHAFCPSAKGAAHLLFVSGEFEAFGDILFPANVAFLIFAMRTL